MVFVWSWLEELVVTGSFINPNIDFIERTLTAHFDKVGTP